MKNQTVKWLEFAIDQFESKKSEIDDSKQLDHLAFQAAIDEINDCITWLDESGVE